jgi:hypothetical protein
MYRLYFIILFAFTCSIPVQACDKAKGQNKGNQQAHQKSEWKQKEQAHWKNQQQSKEKQWNQNKAQGHCKNGSPDSKGEKEGFNKPPYKQGNGEYAQGDSNHPMKAQGAPQGKQCSKGDKATSDGSQYTSKDPAEYYKNRGDQIVEHYAKGGNSGQHYGKKEHGEKQYSSETEKQKKEHFNRSGGGDGTNPGGHGNENGYENPGQQHSNSQRSSASLADIEAAIAAAYGKKDK